MKAVHDLDDGLGKPDIQGRHESAVAVDLAWSVFGVDEKKDKLGV